MYGSRIWNIKQEKVNAPEKLKIKPSLEITSKDFLGKATVRLFKTCL